MRMLRNTAEPLNSTMLHGFAVVAIIVSIISVFRWTAVGVGIGGTERFMLIMAALGSLVTLPTLRSVTKAWHVRHSKLAGRCSHRSI
jgi:low temperature requirement protein LtrA